MRDDLENAISTLLTESYEGDGEFGLTFGILTAEAFRDFEADEFGSVEEYAALVQIFTEAPALLYGETDSGFICYIAAEEEVARKGFKNLLSRYHKFIEETSEVN